MAAAEKQCPQVAGIRTAGRGGKPRATAPGGNPTPGGAQLKAAAEKKRSVATTAVPRRGLVAHRSLPVQEPDKGNGATRRKRLVTLWPVMEPTERLCKRPLKGMNK